MTLTVGGRAPLGWRRWAAFGIIVGAFLAAQIHAIFIEKAGVALNPPRGGASLSPEVAGAVRLSQSFRVSALGFRGVVVYPRQVGEKVSGDAALELSVVHAEGDETLVRTVVPASEMIGRSTFTFSFPPIDRPSGRLFRFTVTLPRTPFGEGLTFRTVEADVYWDGVAEVDGVELWGDLAFETVASGAVLVNRLDEAFRAYPPWMRSIWFIGALLVSFNALVVWATWFAVSGPPEQASAETEAGAGGVTWRRLHRGLAWAAVLGLAVFAIEYAGRERVLVDLVDEFPHATKRTTMASLHQGFSVQFTGIQGRLRPCIQALPFSRITFPVDVPPDAEFAAWVGMRPDVWEGPGDGATFRIGFGDGVTYEEPYRRHFYPLERRIDRVLAPVRLDLSKYAGQRIDVVLNTEPSFNAVGDAALWCEPRIVKR